MPTVVPFLTLGPRIDFLSQRITTRDGENPNLPSAESASETMTQFL